MKLVFLLFLSMNISASNSYVNCNHLHDYSISDIVLNAYRNNSYNSISRCPFKESCSNYFERNIKEKGLLLGLVHFIDRYYYRENKSSLSKYPLYFEKDYKVKYDDKINYSTWDYLKY